MSRLNSLSLKLSNMIRHASMQQQRTACLLACEMAVSQAQLKNSLVSEILGKFRAAQEFTPQDKAMIDDLLTKLDEEYFSLQEAAESGRASANDYLQAFARARAAAALSFAISPSPDAVGEAIYEASAVFGDNTAQFLLHVESALQ